MQAQMTFKEVNAVGLRNVIEQLTTINPVTGELKPMLATSWEPVDDETWRFHLRQGVTFHDGSPFNAEAAAFLVNWVWDPANLFGIREANAGAPITAEVVDDYTIDVRNSRGPDPILPHRLYLSGITSMEQIKNDLANVDRVPIGTGPYKFVEWATGQHWEAEVNPDWSGLSTDDRPGVYGEQLFERLRFVFRPEEAVRAAMLRRGRHCHVPGAGPVRAGGCQLGHAMPGGRFRHLHLDAPGLPRGAPGAQRPARARGPVHRRRHAGDRRAHHRPGHASERADAARRGGRPRPGPRALWLRSRAGARAARPGPRRRGRPRRSDAAHRRPGSGRARAMAR